MGGGGQLLSYIITNDNPYNIYRIYCLSSTLTPLHIDYIIFLDSDDYWKLNCIEECVKHSNGVDIVWLNNDYSAKYNNGDIDNQETTMQECFDFKENGCLKRAEWLEQCVKDNIRAFYFAWSGLIDFNFLKTIQLYFLNDVIHEDHNFGCLLFLQSKNIYVLKEKLYCYRIRPNSITRFNSKNPHIVPHCKHIYEAFNNARLAKQYHIYSSWFLQLLELIDFMQANPSKDNEIIEQLFFPMYIAYSIKLLDFKQDPLNLLPKIHTIEPYLKKGFKYRHKLRLTNPKKYNKLKPLFAFYDSIKLVERGIRRIFKNT